MDSALDGLAGPGLTHLHHLTHMCAVANICVMELTISDVARQYARSDRFVQQALTRGRLHGHRRLGRQVTVDDVAARSWARSLGRGRVWEDETAAAALDLLDTGDTDRLSTSARSRLRSRLRVMTAQQMAHALGGLRSWARYRGTAPVDAERVGPSTASEIGLGLVGGEDWMTFIRVADLDTFELDHDVVLDADGNLGVVQREAGMTGRSRALVDTYLLGDARQSAAAAAALEERARR